MKERAHSLPEEAYFSITEAARLLGVSHQAVSSAIYERRLRAEGGPRGWRIPASELVRYAIRSGWQPDEFAQRIQEETRADWKTIALWILVAFGVGWVLSELLKPRNGGE